MIGPHSSQRGCRTLRATAALVVAVGVTATAGCHAAPDPATVAGPSAGKEGSLTVYAAASLTDSFTELLEAFARQHPEIDVRPASFDGSSTLAAQLAAGAPADVFASADRASMQKVADLVEEPVVFASNTLEIAVAPGNPLGIRSLTDLGRPDVTSVLCAPEVPCGRASQRLLALDGVTLTPASEELTVTAVLTRVALGEADAGLVYRTDIAAAHGRVTGVAPQNSGEVVNEYPIAALEDAPNPTGARAFIAFVTSDPGRRILDRYGFGAP